MDDAEKIVQQVKLIGILKSANIWFDHSPIKQELIHILTNVHRTPDRKDVLESVILELFSGEKWDIYIGLSVFYTQIYLEENDSVSFFVDRQKLAESAQYYIEMKQDGAKDALWPAINMYRYRMSHEFGIAT